MAFLTIITSVKPFVDPHIIVLQRNAFQSWKALGPDVDIVVVGVEKGLDEVCAEMNIKHVKSIQRSASGTPLVSSIFELGRNATDSPVLAYVNSDIILLPDFLKGAQEAARKYKQFVIVGQRWDLEVNDLLDFSNGYADRLMAQLKAKGGRHHRTGSDYFIYTRDCYTDMPELIVGRSYWDNWMIYKARRSHWPTIDASEGIQIIHQNHDYSHLPGGQSHHKHPDTFENIRLGGGTRTAFLLDDCTECLTPNGLAPLPWTWKRFWREVEICPLLTVHSYFLAQLTYAILHPVRAYRDFRAWRRNHQASANIPV